jgi:hypothetical protein
MAQVLTNPLFIIFAAITLISVVPTIAHYWYKARQAEIDANLKHEMLQRGMSAEDIERVLAAPGKVPGKKCEAIRSDRG